MPLSGITQPEPGMPSEPGKCYAKCLVSNTINKKTYLYHQPIGFIPSPTKSKVVIINVIEERRQEWVKKRASKDCESSDPEDCLVWCLVDVPPLLDTIYLVKEDEKFINNYLANPENFITKSVVTSELLNVGGYTEWQEVLCGDSPIYNETIIKVKTALARYDYEISSEEGFNRNTKANLVAYQKDNHLPIGNLDMKTLESLGIEIKNDKFVNPKEGNLLPSKSSKCEWITYSEPITKRDTIIYTGMVYKGDSPKKLNYNNYTNKANVKSKNYDPANSNHDIVKDAKFERLFKKSPNDFTEQEKTVVAEKTIRKGGTEYFNCLCLDNPELDAIKTNIELRLQQLGYQVDGAFGEETQRSLGKFQLKFMRPIGTFDLVTLTLLGVEY
jgi:hypothetical protein